MIPARVYPGAAGCLLTRLTGGLIAIRRVEGGPEAFEGLFQHGDDEPEGLRLLVYGHKLTAELLDLVERAVARRANPSERRICVVVQQGEDKQFCCAPCSTKCSSRIDPRRAA